MKSTGNGSVLKNQLRAKLTGQIRLGTAKVLGVNVCPDKWLPCPCMLLPLFLHVATLGNFFLGESTNPYYDKLCC